jgi:hypothetical protein
MTKHRNIEIFEALVARNLRRLYQEFPNPIRFDASSVGHDVAESLGSDDAEAMRILTDYSENSFEFLVREGFVVYNPKGRYLSDSSTVFPDAVLTLKGFSLLGATPQVVDASVERRSIAQQIDEALDSGARATIGELVKKLFFGALSAGASGVGG